MSRRGEIRSFVTAVLAIVSVLAAVTTFPRPASAQIALPGQLIVTITSPSPGATVAGTINVQASVSALGVLVSGVQFQLDGANLGAQDTSSPYSISWSTTGVANGSHTLRAVARDTLGVTYNSDPVIVMVSNAPPPDTTPPAVGITSPVPGATVSGTVTVSATASDNVGVAGVQFFVDGAALGAEDMTSPYSVSWNTASASNGSHTLTARARDAAGNTRTSSAVTVTVSNGPPPDTTPPTVSITSPSSGASVTGTVTVSASASDNVGVAGVQFFVDGAALGAEDTTSPYSVSWDTSAATDGSHSLTAKARDAAGNVATSAAVTVTVSHGGTGGTRRFEEGGATLTPVEAWSATTTSSAGATLSGDRAVYASASGARASFPFQGTGVTWIGLPCEICGFTNIFLDGALVATVDTYASPRPAASKALYAAHNLASGNHTLVIEVTGTQNGASSGANIVVDAFDVEGGPSGGPTVTRVEETDPSVAYTGTWTSQSRTDLSGGTVVESSQIGSTGSLTFNGTGVSWIGFKAPWAGIGEVYLDGTFVATVDSYAPAEQAQAVMYTATGLPAGSHTIRVRCTGTYSSASSSAWIVLDAFDVTP